VTTRRLYYDDAYEKEFEARVVYCEVLPPNLSAGITGTVWGLILDRTAFYPTSGGQPNDLGKIGDANVLDVRDEGDEILHLVDRKPSHPDVNCCINWPRRFDHMQQHTGQHLLSAMFQERFGLPTVSFHLGTELCTIDLRGPEPTDKILEGAERAANQVVFEDRPVNVRYGTADKERGRSRGNPSGHRNRGGGFATLRRYARQEHESDRRRTGATLYEGAAGLARRICVRRQSRASGAA
jgi:alanyl-tRNA synthetase